MAEPSRSSSSGLSSESSISKYLTLPRGAKPTHPKNVSQVRLLTSADTLAQVEEKERKKKLNLNGRKPKGREKAAKAGGTETDSRGTTKKGRNKSRESEGGSRKEERESGKRKVSNEATDVSI